MFYLLTSFILSPYSVWLVSVFSLSRSFCRASFSPVRVLSWAPSSAFSFLSWMLFSPRLFKFTSSSFRIRSDRSVPSSTPHFYSREHGKWKDNSNTPIKKEKDVSETSAADVESGKFPSNAAERKQFLLFQLEVEIFMTTLCRRKTNNYPKLNIFTFSNMEGRVKYLTK